MRSAEQQAKRRLVIVAIGAALVATIVMASYGYAYHAPQPHGVRIAVVAPPPVLARLDAGLSRKAPGAFTLVPAATPTAARAAVLDERVSGALVITRGGPVRVLTAAAAGTTLQQVVQTALSAAAAATKHPVVEDDLVPLRPADRSGQTGFVFYLALLIPSIIGSVAIYLVGRRLRHWWRTGAGLLFALLDGGIGLLILGVGYGGLTTAPLAMYGLACFGAFTYALCIGSLQTTFGLPGTGIAVLLFLFLGQAVSGSVPVQLLPDVYRQIAPWLPNNAIFSGFRSITYFHAHAIGHPLLVLSLWAGTALLILVANDVLGLVLLRRRPGDDPATVFGEPGVKLVGQLGA